MSTRPPRPAVGSVYRIGPNRWRVARVSRTRAWCVPLQKGTTARWLYLEVLASAAASLENRKEDPHG